MPSSCTPVQALCLALLAPMSLHAAEPTPTVEELYQIIQAQQAQIDSLVGQREGISEGGATRIGGYGELHYNRLDSKTEMDFHRFVLFFAHDFDEDVRFFSEFELEHALAGESKPGEVELEQAYVELDLNDAHLLRAGLFLVPVGILNETHEPPTFYGVERNPIESNIIPSTWWEGGVGLAGRFGDSGFGYDIAVHSGLKVAANLNIRNGRQKVANAVADELASTARIKYTGVPGLELAASLSVQSDVGQDLVAGLDGATLTTAHAVWEEGRFSSRALWARWKLDGAAPAAADKDVQDGYYIEGAWRTSQRAGVFARYSEWDNGGAGDTTRGQINAGFNWWPHPNVVFKLDWQDQRKSVDDDGLNLGVGFRF
jgi:hypothetical protein